MSSMRFNAHLDTSHHGSPHPYKDAGAVADSLTRIHNAMVKCLFVVNRSCIHKGLHLFPQVKIQGIQTWRAWRPCSRSSSTYPSVMRGVTENISHSAALMCRSTTCMYHIRALTASDTSSSSFGRSGNMKSRQWLPVSRCGKA
jgi:hypothetical protein